MLVQTAYIAGTTPAEYDQLLAEGWFRGTGIVYKSEIVCIHESMYSVQHIRMDIQNFKRRRSHEKLFRRNGKKFRHYFADPQKDERREELYRGHMSRFLAFVHGGFAEMMRANRHAGEFDTKELRIYDGDKLIAVSYFDVGEKSIASAMCLYDQEYCKYSLGIYTMLLEMEYGLKRNMDYYYPGYILDQPTAFDYKLSLGTCEWMSDYGIWYPADDLPPSRSRGSVFRDKAAELQVLMTLKGIESKYRIYPYFTLGHVAHDDKDMLKLPFYLEFEENGIEMGASYDHEIDMFVVFRLEEVEETGLTLSLHLSNDYKHGNSYDFRILRGCDYQLLESYLTQHVENRVLDIHEHL